MKPFTTPLGTLLFKWMCVVVTMLMTLWVSTHLSAQRNPTDRGSFGISAGVDIWHKSYEPYMTHNRPSVQLAVDYVSPDNPLGGKAGVLTLGNFRQQEFQLSATHYFAAIQLSHCLPVGNNAIRVYGYAGPALTQSQLTTIDIPGVVEYTYKTERNTTPGGIGGAGISFLWGNLSAGLEIYTVKSKYASVIAGQFKAQDIDVSQVSVQCMIRYAFQVSTGRSSIVCPKF